MRSCWPLRLVCPSIVGIPAAPQPPDQADANEGVEVQGTRALRPFSQSGILSVVDLAVGVDVAED